MVVVVAITKAPSSMSRLSQISITDFFLWALYNEGFLKTFGMKMCLSFLALSVTDVSKVSSSKQQAQYI